MLRVAAVFAVMVAVAFGAGVDIFSLGDQLVSLEDQNQGIQNSVNSLLGSVMLAGQQGDSAMVASINSVATAQILPVGARLATLEILAADFSQAARADVTNLGAKVKAAVSSRISAEASTRASVTTNLNGLINGVATSAGASFTSAQNTRTAQLATMTSTRTAMLTAGGSAFTAAVTAESTRDTQETNDFNSQITTVASVAQVAIDAALSIEPSRANAQCDSTLSSIILKNTTNTNDYASCSNAGEVYYSQGSVTLFYCDGTMFLPMTLGGFYDSQILASRAQVNAMIGTFTSRWVLCYRASTHGYSAYVFHAQCNFKGPTVTIGKTSMNRIFGGFTERAWTSANMQMQSSQALLFRFDPTNTNNINLLNIQSYGNQQYASYDYYYYGPCFGSTGDFYITNAGNYVYFSPSYYSITNSGGLNVALQTTTTTTCGVTTTQTTTSPISVASPWSTGYDSSQLGGSSGVSLTDWEVYYMI